MRILLVTHGFPPRDHGGSQLYAHAHAEAFARAGDVVLVVAREADPVRPEFAVRRERRDGYEVAWVNNTFAAVRSTADLYTDDRIDTVVMGLADVFRPDVAHVHHLTCLSTTIVPALGRRGVPVFMTLHDYWLICHRGQLIDTAMHACAGPEPDGCARCLGAAAAPATAFTARAVAGRWLPVVVGRAVRGPVARALGAALPAGTGREASAARMTHMRAMAGHVTHFFAPSRHVRDRFVAFGIEASRISVSALGWALPGRRPPTGDAGRPRGGPLRIGFLGSLMASKAPHVLIDAAAQLPAGSVQVDVFGAATGYHGDTSYATTLAARLRQPFVTVHDVVPRAALADAFAAIDVLAVPSIWRENCPLVVLEAFLAGVPVVASRVGGLPEIVTDGVNGLLVEPGDVHGMQRALARLLVEPGLLAGLRAGIPPVRSLEDDVRVMRERYAQAAGRLRQTPAVAIAAVVLNHRTPDDTVLAVRSLLRSRRPLDRVIVVDNDDRESCRDALAPVADRVHYVHTGRNLGYSGGMNVGIREALAGGASLVLLANSDVIVPPETVTILEHALVSTPTAGIAGPIVLARAAPDRVATRGMRYDAATGRMRHVGVGGRLAAAPAPITEVAGVSGCCLLVRRAVIAAIGGLDEAYFFGFEDLDLCLRAHAAGFSTIVVGDATVLHEGQASIGAASPARLYYAARNHLRLTAMRPGRWPGTRRLRSGLVIALNLAHAVRDGRGAPARRLSAVLRGTRDHLRGVYGPAPHDLAPSSGGGPPSRVRIAP